jgi:sugar phosphate isomerase/epimerase
MQLGFVSAILPDLNLDEVLAFAAAERFDCVELMCWPVGKAERKFAGVTHVDVEKFTTADAERVAALVRNHGVAISGLGYYPNILVDNARESQLYIDHLKRVIDAAKLLGLGVVNTFIGRDHTKNLDDNFARFEAVWPAIIRHAEQAGVKIGIENCPMLFSNDEWPGGKNLASSPAVWRRMFAAIPSDHFGLNYDPSHFILQFMDYVRPLKEFKHKLFHLHAKDLKIEHDKLNDHGALVQGWSTPKIPGLGDIQWPKFISALTDVGYDGPVCIEVEDDAFRGSLAARQRSLRIARDVLRPLLG